MSINAEAYSDDLKNIAKAVVEERASRRSDRTTVTTGEAYADAIASSNNTKRAAPAPKKQQTAKRADADRAGD